MSEESLQASSQDSSQPTTEDSLQTSSEESSRTSTEQSSQESTQTTSDNSFQWSTEETTVQSTENTTQATSDESAEIGDASAITMVVAGAAVSIGLTAVGVTYLIEVTGATRTGVIEFQDQIYAAYGPDYQRVIDELGIGGPELVAANDQLIAEGWVINSDRDAARYLVALMLILTGQSPAGIRTEDAAFRTGPCAAA
jgi:hypothetical protein